MTTNDNGKNRVTIKDVAKAANVSIATVSYVLNNKPGQSISDETRKKVLQFANLLGYECNVMAKYLATGKTNTVAAVIKDIKPFASQYYLKLLTELTRLLSRRNLDLRLIDYSDGLSRGSDCDAYITLALSEQEFRAFADTKYVPVIAIDSVIDDFLFYRINDNYSALYDSAKTEQVPVTLLTYELPPELITAAKAVFDDVRVISTLDDLAKIDRTARHVTVSNSIYDNAVKFADVKLCNASFAFKASAAADAVAKAINRIPQSAEEHDIKI